MNKKFLLLLGANQFQRERALIGAEKAFKGKVLTISSLAPFHSNKYPSITIQSVETNPEKLLEDIKKFIKKTKMEISAVIPLNDFVLNAGLAVAEYYKLPYNKRETIKVCRTKDLMKTILSKAGIPVVQSYRFKTFEEALKLTEITNYPLVLKPLNFGGSGGVLKVDNPEQLKNAIIQTKNHLEKFATYYDSDDTHMLIEPYITIKKEVSVEVINTPKFRSAIGITDKFLSAEPYFSEIGHLVPSKLEINKELSSKIKDTAIKACEALDIEYGMAHVEMKVDLNGNIIVIEVGARTAGDGIMDLYEKSTEKNIYELHCKTFLNQMVESDIPAKFFHSAAIGYFHPNLGVIEKIFLENLQEKDLNNIDLIAIRSQVGQKIELAKDWSTRYGFVEYTHFNNPKSENFDLINATNKITQQIFFIKSEL